MFSHNIAIFFEKFSGLIFIVKIVYIIHMNTFGLEKIVGLLYKKTCVFVFSIGFFCAIFSLSFVACYAQNNENEKHDSSRYINNSFFENIKPQEYNTWFGIEDGLYYMRMQKSWRGALFYSPNSVQDVSKTSTLSVPKDVSIPTQYDTIVASIDILKFSPQNFDFSVYSALWEGGKAKTLTEWSVDKNLVAAINASMFLPDGITSNGYLRKNSSLNNKRKGTRLGGFFVADPKKNMQNSDGKSEINLPRAAIIYNNDPHLLRFTSDESLDLAAILDKYNVVVQNFKLLEVGDNLKSTEVASRDTKSQLHTNDNIVGTTNTADMPSVSNSTTDKLKNTSWKSNRRHSITAIAEDVNGNILFLHSQTPITIHNFIKAIKNDSSLNLRRALYTEGGGQANMSLTVSSINKYWLGQKNFLLMFTGQDKLPNVIGVRRN